MLAEVLGESPRSLPRLARREQSSIRYGLEPEIALDWLTPTCVGMAHSLANVPVRVERFTPTCVGMATDMRRYGRGSRGSPPRAWGWREHEEDEQDSRR